MKSMNRTIGVLGLSIMFLALYAAPAGAEGCLEPAGRWPEPYGPATAVAVSGNIVYYGLARTLVVADISDPASPTMLGTTTLPEPAEDIAFLGDIVYVATYSNGMRIIDASDPSNPVESGEYMPPRGRVFGIDADGRYLFLAAHMDGLIILDASIPSAPTLLATADVGVAGFDVVVSGSVAYVAGGVWLRVFGVGYPATPVIVASVRSYTNHLEIGDGRLYALDDGGSYETVLEVYDIQDPSRIRQITSYSFEPEGHDVAFSDGQVFVANAQQVSVLPADSLQQWPTIAAGIFDTTGNAMGIAVSEGYAYVAAGAAGFRVLDVSSPMEPVGIGGAPSSGSTAAVAVSKTRAYAVDCTYRDFPVPESPCTFRVIDVKPGTEPTELGSLELPEVPVEIAVSDDDAYVLSDESFRVIDVSNPTAVAEVFSQEFPNHVASGLAVSGGRAFFSLDGFLSILDVTSPTSPEWLFFGIDLGGVDLAVEDDIAYVTGHVQANQSGFLVLDVSDPSAPQEIGFGETPEPAGRVVVAGGYAYVAELLPSGSVEPHPNLWIFDLADPAAPILVGTYQVPGSHGEGFLDLDVADGLAYLAAFRQEASVKTVLYNYYGIRVVDVSDPVAPVGLEYLESVGNAVRVAAYPGRAILAGGWAGLEVFDSSECSGYIAPPSLVRAVSGRVVP